MLAALADARENRRARQAFEWEAVRRKAEKRAAAKVGRLQLNGPKEHKITND